MKPRISEGSDLQGQDCEVYLSLHKQCLEHWDTEI